MVSPHARSPHLLVGILLNCLTFSSLPVYATPDELHRIKASQLLNIAKFTTWPLRLCIIGDDGLHRVATKLLGDRTVRGRPVTVHRVTTPSTLAGCSVLYIGRINRAATADLLARLNRSPILTAAHSDEIDAIIRFHWVDNRLRFRIDAEVADASGLQLSAELRQLDTHTKCRCDSSF